MIDFSFIFACSIAILAIDLDQRGTGLFRFILDIANANSPILHTKHQRSIPIFQDLIHDAKSNYENPDLLHENNEDVVACVMKASNATQDDSIDSSEEVNQWLRQLVHLRTSGQYPSPSMSKHGDTGHHTPEMTSSSLEDSIALL